MKRIWVRLLGAAALCAVLLAGCSASSGSDSGSAAADPLTGQELLYPGQRPAAVVIDNAPDSTTQWGIGSASVVLETLTHTAVSPSLCLVYPSVQAMPTVGPVTEGSDIYWRLLSGQQVLPIQRGCGRYTRNYLDYYGIQPVDALVVGRNAFTGGAQWVTAPLWRTSGNAVESVLSALNISAALEGEPAADPGEGEPETPSVPALLPMQTGGHLPDADAADAEQVTVTFREQGSTCFAYNAGRGVYGMLHADGTPQRDANTGTQAAFDNLLILYSASETRDDGQTLDYDLSMGGGVWLNGGHLWHITWTQGTHSTLLFYDADGRPLSIESGRSYIALLSSLTGEELSVRNAAGDDLLAVEE